ncbi:hypothetical protein AALA24_09995, partial [Anaerovoracaceae bacterium 42-11]
GPRRPIGEPQDGGYAVDTNSCLAHQNKNRYNWLFYAICSDFFINQFSILCKKSVKLVLKSAF